MVNDDIAYKKYLESCFEPIAEYYYLNLTSGTVVPDYMVSNEVNKADLDYVLSSEMLMNIKGESISNDIVSKVYGVSCGLLSYSYGWHVNIINLATGKKIFQCPNGCPSDSTLIAKNNGYHLIEIEYTGINMSYEYSLINPLGEVVFSEKKSAKTEYKLIAENGLISLFLKKNPVALYQEIIKKAEGYVEKEESPIKEIKANCVTQEIKALFQDFNFPEQLLKRFEKYDLPQSSRIKIRYNVSFLEVFLVAGCQKKYTAVTRNGKIISDRNINNWVISREEGAKFNDEVIMIPKFINCNGNGGIIYLDKDGNKISKFVNVTGYLRVDRHFLNLYQSGRMTDFKATSDSFTYGHLASFRIDGKIYYTSKTFSDGLLLVENERNLFGYLDEFGNVVIEPQFKDASDFRTGVASVTTKLDVDNYYGVRINLDGEFLSRQEQEIIDRVYSRYKGRFDKLETCSTIEQIYHQLYERKYDFLGNHYYLYYDFKNGTPHKLKYRPVRQYENYVICYGEKSFFSKEGYYALDKRTQNMIYLGYSKDLTAFYDDYFVIDGITYYPTDELLNLGNFSLTNRKLKSDVKLKSKEEYIRSRGKTELISKDETLEEKRRKWQEQRAELEKRKQEYKRLQVEKEELERQAQIIEEKQKKLHIVHSLSVPDDFYVEYPNFKRIAPKYLPDLTDYDLFLYDFAGFAIDNVNFRGTNASINPQKVYNKDISGCDLSDVTILSYDFVGVKMENTIFSDDFLKTYQEKVLKLERRK